MSLPQPIATAAPLRVSQIDPAILLGVLAAQDRLGDGRVHILSLDVIRDAFGRRWPERARAVFEMATTRGQHLFAPETTIQRIDETDVLITCAVGEPLVVRGLALRLLDEVLTHFLGEARPPVFTLKLVTGHEAGVLVCRPLDPAELAAARAAADAASPMPPRQALAGRVATTGLVDSITAFDGRRLQVEVDITPVADLNRSGVAGRKVEPRLVWAETGEPLRPAERMDLLAADMEQVDLITLDRALDRLSLQERSASLMVTVSFLTASSQRARTRLMQHPGPLRDAVRHAVIWVLADLPEGVPAGRLTEVVSLLRPFGRAVFAQTRLSASVLKVARSAGLSGLILEPQSDLNDRDMALWLLLAGKQARGATPTLIADNLRSADLFDMAAAADFTHATVRS